MNKKWKAKKMTYFYWSIKTINWVNYLELENNNFAKKLLWKGISDALSFEKIFMKNIKLINKNIISYCSCKISFTNVTYIKMNNNE